MTAVVSTFYPSLALTWSMVVAHIICGFLAAALASALAGVLVFPSLAADAATKVLVRALRQTGQTTTTCVSILLMPYESANRQRGVGNKRQGGGEKEVMAAANGGGLGGNSGVGSGRSRGGGVAQTSAQPPAVSGTRQALTHQPSRSVSTELAMMNMYQTETKPGHWGLRSYVSVASDMDPRRAGMQTAAAAAAAVAAVAGDCPPPHEGSEVDLTHSQSSSSSSGSRVGVQGERRAVVPQGSGEGGGYSSQQPQQQQQQERQGAAQDVEVGGITEEQKQFGKSQRPNHGHTLLQRLQRMQHGKHKKRATKQQQAQQPQQQHVILRLGRGVDLIRPLIQELKRLRDAVVVEQAWWLRVMLGGSSRVRVDLKAWGQVVTALEQLVDR